jgi:hypothetical protein
MIGDCHEKSTQRTARLSSDYLTTHRIRSAVFNPLRGGGLPVKEGVRHACRVDDSRPHDGDLESSGPLIWAERRVCDAQLIEHVFGNANGG